MATASFRLRPPSESAFQVKHLEKPPSFVKPKRIHARRVLPLVKEGIEREFHSVSLATTFFPARALRAPTRGAAEDLSLALNSELAVPGQQQTASNVGEPSTAINGQMVVFTGNWYAAVSSDGGRTFQYINPTAEFATANPPGSQFCCDQVVHYISQIDTFVWLQQYGPDTDNIQRLAFANSQEVAAGRWQLFDIGTQDLGVPGAFLDFPDLAVGPGFLYMTTNIFVGTDQAGCAVVRIPIAGIASRQATAQRYVTMDLQSFRVAQNCGTTAFFAAHQDTSTLRVFSWDEREAEPTSALVGVARWIGGNGYQSRTPDGRRWLDRADPRITGATLAGNDLWFAWAVDRGSNHRPKPFVQIARISSRDMTLIENINIFDPEAATAYAALSTNANNEVGISYMMGGGPRYPSHVVGILTGTRKDVVVAAGDRGPLPDSQTGKGEWGDFLTVRRASPQQALFAATGYTLEGSGDGSNRDATPRLVVFGRSGDVGVVSPAPVGPGPAVVSPGPVPVGAGPVTDVDLLPTVSPTIAGEIKAAAGVSEGPPAAEAMAAPMQPELVTAPGKERWPVKTGTDPDVAQVGKNVIAGRDLGAGIVPATVEELISVPRPADMQDPTTDYPAYQSHRSAPMESTIWQVDTTITAMKLEADGDYHLVLQGASGETMIGEIPTPTTEFLGDSPWITNIGEARKAVDDGLVSQLSPADFVPMGNRLVPRQSVTGPVEAAFAPPASFRTPAEAGQEGVPLFKTAITPKRARIVGVGFFDRVHGQMGVSQSNGIELHPILKIEWL